MSGIVLRVLGRIEAVDAAGRELPALTRQPKLVALLTYCAVEGGGRGVAVDRLCAVFWPDSALDRARRTMNQLLAEGRRALGADVIERRRGVSLRIRPGTLVCDAAELLHGAVGNDAVAESYTGELLPGVRLPDAPEFEDWLDRTRTRTRDHAVRLLLDRAAAVPAAAALELARRALVLDPLCEEAAIRAIEALGELGERGAAWRLFQDFRARFRDALDLDPGARLTRTAARVCASATTRVPPPPAPVDPPGPLPPAATAAPRRARRRAGRIIAGAAVVVMASVVVVRHVMPRPAEADIVPRWLADIAVEVGAEASDAVWHAIAARELADRLAEHGARVARVAAAGDAASARSRAAPFVVHGRLTHGPDGVTGLVQLEDAHSGALLGSWRIDAQPDDLSPRLAALADSIRRTAGLADGIASLRGTRRDPRAVAAAVAARAHLYDARSAERNGAHDVLAVQLALADSLARVAGAADPTWAQAHLLLAEALERRAMIAARDPDRGAAHEQARAAIEAATRAIELGAGEPGLERRGGLYFFAWMLGVPLPHEPRAAAAADLARAVRGGSAGAQSWAVLSGLYHADGRMHDAYAAAERALALDVFGRSTENILLRLFHSAFDAGRDADAARWCAALERRSAGRAHVAECRLYTLAWSGADAAAVAAVDLSLPGEPPAFAAAMRPRLELLRAAVHASNGAAVRARVLLAQADVSGTDPELLRIAAMTHAQLGDHDTARALLGDYVAGRAPTRGTVLFSRWFRPLHDSDSDGAEPARAFAAAVLSSAGSTTPHR